MLNEDRLDRLIGEIKTAFADKDLFIALQEHDEANARPVYGAEGFNGMDLSYGHIRWSRGRFSK